MPEIQGLSEVLAGLGLSLDLIVGGMTFVGGATALIKRRMMTRLSGASTLITAGLLAVVYSVALATGAKGIIGTAVFSWGFAVLANEWLGERKA